MGFVGAQIPFLNTEVCACEHGKQPRLCDKGSEHLCAAVSNH